LEGLVIKDALSQYEPGRRKWLKIKRDYLGDGAMADSADLVVLGGYFGTGSKGGKVSVFLCGVYDKTSRQWKTVRAAMRCRGPCAVVDVDHGTTTRWPKLATATTTTQSTA
jgi:ATP-dependent DNA ligase